MCSQTWTLLVSVCALPLRLYVYLFIHYSLFSCMFSRSLMSLFQVSAFPICICLPASVIHSSIHHWSWRLWCWSGRRLILEKTLRWKTSSLCIPVMKVNTNRAQLRYWWPGTPSSKGVLRRMVTLARGTGATIFTLDRSQEPRISLHRKDIKLPSSQMAPLFQPFPLPPLL